MHIRVRTLSENSASWLGYLGEWGLSILVDVDDDTILVDTGGGIVAAHNSLVMGIDLKKIRALLFSHGHEDHTGGLLPLLKLRKTPLEIIAHPEVWAPKYWKDADSENHRYIGIPYLREYAESFGAHFTLSTKPEWITDSIVTSGEVPMITGYETIDASASVKTPEGFGPDPLKDDQSLFIKSDKGLIVISGCAHRGIVNTIFHGMTITGCDECYAVIGGTHLFGAPESRIQQTIKDLQKAGVKRLGVSHCTGPYAGAVLQQAFQEKFFFNFAGTTTILDV
ncbi:MAG TPA: MBL fold metallo-hydrolase [Desulfobacteraceae bacterium]|jgi:7,8-dihydropterin-6-yl-methyl-4-(beta-D-ribofuranosyl)aminobenzene 5'-phosphate synthase|nr:MBL fold metallo-hydrolase [Desulfobacteraceae bacterium]